MGKTDDGKKAILHYFRDIDTAYEHKGYYDKLARMLGRLVEDAKEESKNRYESAVRALSDTYNYFDDGFLPKLRDDLYKAYLRNDDSFSLFDIDEGMEQLLYSWLVMMFGDYGTSPRVGWITHMSEAVAWLDEFMKDWQKEEK